MKSRFEIKSEKINKKKYDITKDIMSSLCDKRSPLNRKRLERKLKRYARDMINLEKKKYNIHTPLIINNLKSVEYAGGIQFPDIPKLKSNNHKGQKENSLLIPEISIDFDSITYALKSKNKEDRTNGFLSYMSTIHHEMRHLEQNISTKKVGKIQDVTREEALKYAKEFAAIDFSGNKYYHTGDNYRKQLIEQNARINEFGSVLDIMGKNVQKRPIVKKYLLNGLDDTFNDIYIETEKLDFLGKTNDRDIITTDVVDKAIAKYPKFLKKYPILKKEYNKDGSRKECYQIIKENAKASFRIKHNPFYSKEKRKEKLKEVNNMYSSIFLAGKESYTEKDLIKTEKMVGSKAMKMMLKQSKSYLENKEKELKKYADEEEKIREFLGEPTYEAHSKRRERDSAIQGKYASDIQDIEDGIDFYKQGGYKNRQMSIFDKRNQEKRDKQKIEKNYKLKITPRKNKTSYRAKQVNLNQNFDLDEMKNLSIGYKKLKNSSEHSLTKCKEEYEYLLSKKENTRKGKDMKDKNIDIGLR